MAGIDFQRCVERGNVLVELQDAPHIGGRAIDQGGYSLHRRLPAGRRFEMANGAQDEVDFLDHMNRQPDGARLIHDAALNALAHPPGRVGGKPETAFRIEFLQRVNQAEVPFFDQVEQRYAPVEVMLGDIHDQAQVVLDHFLARLEVAGTHQSSGRHLFFRRQ